MAIEELVKPGMRVLDIGSGSALLSILAAKFGAREVLGVDIDVEAVRAGRENVQKNNVSDQVYIEPGSYDHGTGIYDVVVANILAGVIIKMLEAGLAQRGNRFVFSGILDTQLPRVSDSISQAGMHIIEKKQSADWVCLICEAVP